MERVIDQWNNDDNLRGKVWLLGDLKNVYISDQTKHTGHVAVFTASEIPRVIAALQEAHRLLSPESAPIVEPTQMDEVVRLAKRLCDSALPMGGEEVDLIVDPQDVGELAQALAALSPIPAPTEPQGVEFAGITFENLRDTSPKSEQGEPTKPVYKVGDLVDVSEDAKRFSVTMNHARATRHDIANSCAGMRMRVTAVHEHIGMLALSDAPGTYVHIDDVSPAPTEGEPQTVRAEMLPDLSVRVMPPAEKGDWGHAAASPKVDPAAEARRAYILDKAPTIAASLNIISMMQYLHAGGHSTGIDPVAEAIQTAADLYDAPIPPIAEKEKA